MAEVLQVTTPEQFEAALELRRKVFVDEQQVDPDAERDELDDAPDTIHCVVYDGGICVGTGRVVLTDTEGVLRIGRIAVAASARGTGVGRQIMEFLEGEGLAQLATTGTIRFELSGQLQAEQFYANLGYTVYGPTYLDEDIPHRAFFKELPN